MPSLPMIWSRGTADDLVARDFNAQHPGEKVLNDITEMQCKDGKLYLAATLDCFDGAIIGMAMGDNKRAEICCDSFENARRRFGLTSNVIVHSDHGSQYTSRIFRALRNL